MTTQRRSLASTQLVLPQWHLDLRTFKDATLVVLLLRLGWWVVALPISMMFPLLPLEKNTSVLPGGSSPQAWLQRVFVAPFVRFDAVRYQQIVERGYHLADGNAAFHPLYPLLAAVVRPALGGNSALALQAVSAVATITLCVVFTRYVADVHDAGIAQSAGWLLLLTPPAFVLLMPYTESTFLVFAVSSLWAMQRRHWWLAGVFGGLATLTRQQGIALAVPLAWLLYVALRQRQLRVRDLGTMLLIPGCYALFVLYRAVALGDLAAAAQAKTPVKLLRNVLISPSSEHVIPGQRIAWPWELFIDQLRIIPISPNGYHLIFDMALGWLGISLIVAGFKHITIAERWYSIVVISLSLCYYNGQAFPYLSLPRHVLVVFPLFIALAHRINSFRYQRFLLILWLCNVALLVLCTRDIWVP